MGKLMDEMWLVGYRYVRTDSNLPWTIPNEEVIEKTDLQGNITYYEIRGEVQWDFPPNAKQNYN